MLFIRSHLFLTTNGQHNTQILTTLCTWEELEHPAASQSSSPDITNAPVAALFQNLVQNLLMNCYKHIFIPVIFATATYTCY